METHGGPNARDTLTEANDLEALRQEAIDLYIRKAYMQSADAFAQASEIQAKLYGEDDPLNADLLRLYGRTLYQLGVSKSDVLGGRAAPEDDTAVSKPTTKLKSTTGPKTQGGPENGAIGEAIGNGEKRTLDQAMAENGLTKSRPFFSITGDENLEEDRGAFVRDDEEDERAEDEDQEVEDDLSLAWEILDLSRVLFDKQLHQASVKSERSDQSPSQVVEPPAKNTFSQREASPRIALPVKQIEENLSEVHDILAEISLESEDFPAAVSDFRISLNYKLKLYPSESEIIAEAHYKLSLALEFAAGTITTKDENGTLKSEARDIPDSSGRKEAAQQMEEAIGSCRGRVANEEKNLKELGVSGDDGKKSKKIVKVIADVKEMIDEMEQRMVDLRGPTPGSEQAGQKSERDELKEMLGAMMGQMPEDAKNQIKHAVDNATDLSSVVRKKKADSAKQPTVAGDSDQLGSKRKASGKLDQDSPDKARRPDTDSKRARIEEVEDDGT